MRIVNLPIKFGNRSAILIVKQVIILLSTVVELIVIQSPELVGLQVELVGKTRSLIEPLTIVVDTVVDVQWRIVAGGDCVRTVLSMVFGDWVLTKMSTWLAMARHELRYTMTSNHH